jgi:hypothetical protein
MRCLVHVIVEHHVAVGDENKFSSSLPCLVAKYRGMGGGRCDRGVRWEEYTEVGDGRWEVGGGRCQG